MRYAQLVMGPAGSGKSTYCSVMQQHCQNMNRTVHVINLDPAAEHFEYPITADIRELVHVEDVMEADDLKLGPNGALVFCMQHLVENLDWLKEQLGEGEDDYFLFDCPGQIELYTHLPVMKQLVSELELMDFRVAGVFLLDSQFLIDTAKFFSGILAAMSAMLQLAIPHHNIMSKMDKLSPSQQADVERYLEPNAELLLMDLRQTSNAKFQLLNEALAGLIDTSCNVSFLPLNINDEESISNVMLSVDLIIQYGEDLDVKVPVDAEEDGDED
ncbi:GPN-loop GTPase 3-like [Sycon ciliatum]|uniref:GPN-loop GTPase 3-like n=1 Tax=Sycon ciliatum TaxID=27933 RepID=UPI0020A98C1C|eukprot:scpid93792/ scgid8770/ GPN-loop GTPase 3; ATP-binding domain 1 family member C